MINNFVGGMMAKSAIAPFDRWKLLLQLHGPQPWHRFFVPQANRGAHTLCNTKVAVLPVGKMADTLRNLWKGNLISCAKSGWFATLFLTTNESLKHALVNRRRIAHCDLERFDLENANGQFDAHLNVTLSPPQLYKWSSLSETERQTIVVTSGMISGWFAQTCAQPLDQWRTIYSGDVHSGSSPRGFIARTRGMFQVVQRLVQERMIMQGYGVSILSSLPYNITVLMFQHNFHHHLGLSNAIAGSLAGACATSALYGLDTTRKQVMYSCPRQSVLVVMRAIAASGRVRGRSTIRGFLRQKRQQISAPSSHLQSQLSTVMRLIYLSSSTWSFYNGVLPTLFKSLVNNGIRWWFVDQTQKKER